MAYALLQSQHNNQASSLTFPGNCTPGSLLVLAACYSDGADLTSITDGGNTWIQIGTTQNDAGNGQECSFWYAVNNQSTAITVTPHATSINAQSFALAEFSGVVTTSPLRTSDTTRAFSSTGTGTDAETATSITPTAGDLLVAAFADTGGNQSSVTNGTGFSSSTVVELGAAGITGASALEWESAPGGAQVATYTVGTGSHSYTIQVAAFKPAVVAPTDTGAARTQIQIPNRSVGPMALRNLYRTATPTAPTADASQLPITIGAPPAPLKLPNPYVGPMALRQVTKLPPPPLPSIGVTDSVGFATTGASVPSFSVTDTASPTVVLPFRIPNRNVGPMALRQAYRQPGFQSVNTAGGVTQTFGFNTTGSSAPAFTLAGMTDTFTFSTTGTSAPVFTLAGMSDVFVLSTTGKSTPAFVLAGMTDVFVVSSTGVSTPAFAVIDIPAGGSTDVFSFSATGSSTTRFGLIFFSLNREGDRVSREAGLGLGSMYEYANYTTATSASAAEHSRVNAGVGLGAGSHIDFTNAAAKTDEATTEGNRVKDLAGIGGGSQANL